jgi:peptidoglycan/LPS O-acetylase OafA/YrhL
VANRAAAPSDAAGSHLWFLDGVRGLAALYVIIHHATMNLPSLSNVPASRVEALFLRWGQYGHYAVDIFILLSGYCLMLPYLGGRRAFDLPLFLKKRAWRILPPYYLATLMSLVLIWTVIGAATGTHWDVSIPVTGEDIAYHLLLFHDWSKSAPKINHAFWSIAVEWKIYFLFPVLLALRSRFGAAKMAAIALGTGYAAWLVCERAQILNPSPWGSSFYYLGLFALGMFAAEIAEGAVRAPSPAQRHWRVAFIALSVLLYLVGKRWHGTPIPLQVQSFFAGTWATALLVSLRLGLFPAWFASIFTNRASVALGRIAYSSYLVHAPVLQLVFLYLMKPLVDWRFRQPVMVAASVVASLVVATLFYWVAEKPFHELSRRAGAPRAAATRAAR